jgi:DNA polymerase III delta prime subunit
MNDAASLSKQSSAPPHELQDFTERNVNAPQVATESSSGVDEDPNESRRKRRKTDKSQRAEPTATSNAGLSAWLGNGNPMPITTPAETCVDNEVNLPTFQPQPPLAQAQFSADATVLSTTMETEQPEEQTERSSARQKTLKLNPNGKFLSSPASSPPRDTKKRATGKRGRPPKVRSKLVIIKYTVGPEIKTGEHIDSILSGKLVHRPPVPVAKTTLPSRKPATIKSSKPTHPFFTKKPAQKTDDQIVADSKDEPRNASKLDHLPAGTIENKRRVVAGSMPSFSTFGRRVSKFPELLDPLWPPQGLVHIRDVCLPICATDTAWQTAKDRKKSKIAAISIRDEENVLLTGTAEARRITKQSENSQDAVTSLRHPVRHVASNQILRTAMEKQMSWSSPNPRFPWNASSPPLAKIGTSLLSSVSAFDCGKYETQLWTQKYAPKAAEEVLQLGREPQMLRDWLRHLTITAVDTGKPPKDTTKSKSKRDKKRKKRQKAEKLDGFIVSSEEEASEMDNLSGSDDELAGGVTTGQRTVVRSGDMATAEKIQMTNAILLSGPAGCGKTASVYAVAKELDFEVFEINPGSRRSARDMLERVGDMTQNHLVHLLNESENPVESMKDDGKQNKLMGFFKGSSKPKQPATLPGLSPKPEADPKRPRQQKQSLILLEEADLLFEEDKQFWTGVLTLIAQSRRPIIITCNDESLIPTQDMSLHAILRYQKAPQDFSVDYLLLVAANEGHILKREAVTRLYQGSGMDLRKSLMDLNFWCQMGVGSEKAGLDWLLPAWPPESNVDFNGDRVRVLSLNTYERYMGWFNRDLLFSGDALEKEAEVNRNILHWWGLGLQESEDVGGRSEVGLLQPTQFQSSSKAVQLDMLCREADYYDMRSSLDILCSSCSIDMTNVSGIYTDADRHPLTSTRTALISRLHLFQKATDQTISTHTHSSNQTCGLNIRRLVKPSVPHSMPCSAKISVPLPKQTWNHHTPVESWARSSVLAILTIPLLLLLFLNSSASSNP